MGCRKLAWRQGSVAGVAVDLTDDARESAKGAREVMGSAGVDRPHAAGFGKAVAKAARWDGVKS